MSFKDFLFLFIILPLKVVCPSKDEYTSADNCVRFKWNHDFASSFFPKYNQSNWKNRVNNIIHDCLDRSAVKGGNESCNVALVNVKFPLISLYPNITLMELQHSPVLAIKEAPFSTGRQILYAFQQIWQLFVLSIMAAVLSGIVIWFLEGIQCSFSNSMA